MSESACYALITGAAGGIGTALVRAFSEAGYAVIATDRAPRPSELECACFLQVDVERTVTDPAFADAVFAEVRGIVGSSGLRALINNAAIQVLGGIDSLSRADWHTTLDTNLIAPFIWTQALLPELEAAQGCVVNISSIHARLTKRNFVAYATSKAALSGMTRALAIDVGNRIRVNAIEPAAIETDMLRAGFSAHPERFPLLEQCHPRERIGLPAEVAAVALALVRHDLPFWSGACVPLDGGIGNRLHDPD